MKWEWRGGPVGGGGGQTREEEEAEKGKVSWVPRKMTFVTITAGNIHIVLFSPLCETSQNELFFSVP